MYAVFQTGGKQYRVIEGQVVNIERLNVSIGNCVEFSQVLFFKDDISCYIGKPFIKNVKVIAKIVDHHVGQKIKIIKFRRRKHFRKCQGHRQCFTRIKIININSI